jgi:hypothetical protein
MTKHSALDEQAHPLEHPRRDAESVEDTFGLGMNRSRSYQAADRLCSCFYAGTARLFQAVARGVRCYHGPVVAFQSSLLSRVTLSSFPSLF